MGIRQWLPALPTVGLPVCIHVYLQIQTYNIYEVGYEDIALYSGLSRQFHFRRLSPYTEYHLILEACTGRETCTRSLPSTVRTAETAPENQSPPQLTTRNATAILITWSKPTRANGRVISYQVIRKDLPKSIQVNIQYFVTSVVAHIAFNS